MLGITDLEDKVVFHPQTKGDLIGSTPLEPAGRVKVSAGLWISH